MNGTETYPFIYLSLFALYSPLFTQVKMLQLRLTTAKNLTHVVRMQLRKLFLFFHFLSFCLLFFFWINQITVEYCYLIAQFNSVHDFYAV